MLRRLYNTCAPLVQNQRKLMGAMYATPTPLHVVMQRFWHETPEAARLPVCSSFVYKQNCTNCSAYKSFCDIVWQPDFSTKVEMRITDTISIKVMNADGRMTSEWTGSVDKLDVVVKVLLQHLSPVV